jgi:hypothetical protein
LKVRFCVNFLFSASKNIRTRGVQAGKRIGPVSPDAKEKEPKKMKDEEKGWAEGRNEQ